MARVAIVGAGISGLGAAYALQKAGHEVVVLERSGLVSWSISSTEHALMSGQRAAAEVLRSLQVPG